MRSHFSAQTLAEIFRDLFLGERTGVLVLTHDDHEKRVYFDRGLILYAESSVDTEDLGRCLVGEGQLSEGALSEAIESLSGSMSMSGLASALVRRELIVRGSLNRTAQAIVERVVESVFAWEGGSARFHEEEAEPTVFETDVLRTAGVLLRGVFGMAGFEPIHEAMHGLENRLRIRKPAPLPLERLALSAAHGFILSRIDGRSSLRDVISILPPGEEEVAARLLFGLLVMGLVEYDPPISKGPFKVADILRDHEDRRSLERMQEQMIRQAYTQIREQSPYDVLGIAQNAKAEQVERAYQQAKAQFSRERVLPTVQEKFRSELTLIESRLIEAYLTLTQVDTGPSRARGRGEVPQEQDVSSLNVRVEMDRAESKVAEDEAHEVADRYFAKARRYAREGDFHNAIQYCKLAISHNASDARYYHQLADCLVRNPEARWQRLAEENYTRATELDPWKAEYWVSLGQLYKGQGLKLRAKKQFQEALKLVPNNPDVIAGLRSVS